MEKTLLNSIWNGASPRVTVRHQYNIGEQILIFRIEYDPNVVGVYNSFLIPRSVEDGATRYPLLEMAEQRGLVVDPELKETTRKTNAFADDSNAGLLRCVENLSRVKNILFNFGDISGSSGQNYDFRPLT